LQHPKELGNILPIMNKERKLVQKCNSVILKIIMVMINKKQKTVGKEKIENTNKKRKNFKH
jgi:hypothetical protein